MDEALYAAIITGSVALVTSLIAAGGAIYAAVRTTKNASAVKELEVANWRSMEAFRLQKEVAKYKEPLASAAYDLQSRLYNILHLDFVQRFICTGSDRERGYAIDNTCFLFGQYMCWSELARREIQFINLGKDVETKALLHLQGDIARVWGTDNADSMLRLFAGEQRALGEELIISDGSVSRCIGYGAFLKRCPEETGLMVLLRAEIASLETTLPRATPRLKAVQNALIDLLEQLDPDCIRFPSHRRHKA